MDIEDRIKEERRFTTIESSLVNIDKSLQQLISQVSIANGRTSKNESDITLLGKTVTDLLAKIQYTELFNNVQENKEGVARLTKAAFAKEVEVRLRARDFAILGTTITVLGGIASGIATLVLGAL